MPFSPDADLADADWPKTRTWDLPTDPAWIDGLPIDDLVALMARPSWIPAPEAIRERALQRLADNDLEAPPEYDLGE